MAKSIHLNRENAFMTLRYAALTAVTAFGLAACGSDNNGTASQPGVVNIRVVNSAYQQSAGATSTQNVYTAASIDVLFDSSTSAPSQVAMAPNSVAGGTTGPSPAKLNALYGNLPVGVHSFVARIAGGTSNPTFFTTSSNTQYLPKQYLTAGTYYTFIISGINPTQPSTGSPVLAGSNAFGFALLVDDPFTPPTTDASGTTVLQARFRIINAAPINNSSATISSTSGTGSQAYIFITKAGDVPTSANLGTYSSPTSTSHRSGTAYQNVTAGSYVLTIAAGTSNNSQIRYQGTLTLAAGEVRTIIFQNANNFTMGSGTGESYTWVNSSDFKITNIKDNQY